TLDDRELGSVIMHEVHHHRNRDPLKGFVLSILSHLFFYVPVIRSYADFWQQHREWEADAAARRVSDATSLAHALCKLLTTSPTISGAGGGFALSGGSGSVASPALHGMGNIRERIELLLDLRPTRPWALGAREFGTSVACLTLLGVLSLGLFSPVKMDVSNLLSQPVARTDAMGWVVPQRVDTFWVPPFQGAHQRVRYVGIDPHTAPPSSSHQAQR
ncbi:MAG: M56 family metallopeptidase, partial [bacterium]